LYYKKEKLGMFVVLMWFTVFFVMALQMKEEIRVWPMFCEGMGIILTAGYLGRIIYKEKHGLPITTSAPLDKESLKIMFLSIFFFLAYVVVAYYVGFIVTTFIFCILFSYWQFKNDKKWVYVAVSAGLTLMIFLVFKVFLDIPLPSGLLV